MTHTYKTEVVKYLKSIDIKTMEFFEEMYDHIITSYESRSNKDQSISDHLTHTIQPNFGGVKGIKKVMKAQQKLRQKLITKRSWSLFKSYLFSWPTVLITILITLCITQLNILFEAKGVLIYIMTLSVLFPVVITGIVNTRFYLACKREKRPYNSSDLNLRILTIATLGTSATNIFLNLLIPIIWGDHKSGIEMTAQYPVVQITICVLSVLYALVSIQIVKEKFIFKLTA